MLNFVKYLPLEFSWSRNDKYCVPKGPNFSRAQRIELMMAGNRVHLKVPQHSPYRPSIEQARVLPGHDILAEQQLRDFSSALMPNDHWSYAIPLARTWAFWGPWMSGCRAELAMGVAIIGRQSRHAFNDISFFHPRAFEMVIVQYLNDRYGHKRRGGANSHIPRYHGPIDWKVHENFAVFNATCKVCTRSEDLSKLFNPEHLFFFPISEKYFVQVGFVQHFYSTNEKGQLAFDSTPVQALQDAIFNSIRLELSPENQACYNKIKAEIGNMELTREFAPLKWPVTAQESTNNQQDSLLIER